jgi:hypothetical protein
MITRLSAAMLAILLLCKGLPNLQAFDDETGAKPIQMDKGEIDHSYKALFSKYAPKEKIELLLGALEDANEKGDRGSVFYVGSQLIDEVWKGLSVAIKNWERQNKTPEPPAQDKLDAELKSAIETLDQLATKLERLSVGPFLFDRTREEEMIATTKDKLLLTKVVIRAMLKNDWRKNRALLDVDLKVESLYQVILKLSDGMAALDSRVQTLEKDVQALKKQLTKTPITPSTVFICDSPTSTTSGCRLLHWGRYHR